MYILNEYKNLNMAYKLVILLYSLINCFTLSASILSDRICCRISFGRAPIARRIPIAVVRSFTVTIMILDTPIAPASNVPNPTSRPIY